MYIFPTLFSVRLCALYIYIAFLQTQKISSDSEMWHSNFHFTHFTHIFKVFPNYIPSFQCLSMLNVREACMEFIFKENFNTIVAARSKALNVFARSNAGIVVSNPTPGMYVCLSLF
jgi:hypothetical protein